MVHWFRKCFSTGLSANSIFCISIKIPNRNQKLNSIYRCVASILISVVIFYRYILIQFMDFIGISYTNEPNLKIRLDDFVRNFKSGSQTCNFCSILRKTIKKITSNCSNVSFEKLYIVFTYTLMTLSVSWLDKGDHHQ